MGWQDCVAIGVVLGAVAYLMSLVWGTLAGRKQKGCASACGKCSSGDNKVTRKRGNEPLVTIGLAPSVSNAATTARQTH